MKVTTSIRLLAVQSSTKFATNALAMTTMRETKALFLLVLLLIFSGIAQSQAVIATVPAGSEPWAVAVNTVTNKIYVTNLRSSNITVIDGATNSTATIRDPNALTPVAVAVNPLTNKIYVANVDSNNVTVIDGITNTVRTIQDTDAKSPFDIAVNPVTNKIYVTNMDSSNITVIDGTTNLTTTVTNPDTRFPYHLAVNTATNKIYVTNHGMDVTVIDGVTNSTKMVKDPNGPFRIAVNPVTNKIYVTNNSNVTVIDGATNSTTTVTDPNASNPLNVAVNPVTNKVYVTNMIDNNITVIDGATNTTITLKDPHCYFAGAVAVNPVTDRIYVANSSENLTVINGLNNSILTVADPNARSPLDLEVNSVTNRIYVANNESNNVTVVDGAATLTVRLSSGSLAFGSQSVGTKSASQKVTLTNTGTAPLMIKDIFNVNNADFLETNNCPEGRSLAAGVSCSAWVSFRPIQDGTRSGSIKFIDNAPNSPQIVKLSGTGVGSSPVANLEPSNPISFAPQKVGIMSTAKTLLLTNIGNSTLNILKIAVTGDFLQINNCPASLAPGGRCQIMISFRPTTTGTRTGSLTITDNAPDSPQVSKLSGTGT